MVVSSKAGLHSAVSQASAPILDGPHALSGLSLTWLETKTPKHKPDKAPCAEEIPEGWKEFKNTFGVYSQPVQFLHELLSTRSRLVKDHP